METSLIPVKTALGQDELSQRRRRLSQRHRTVLFLVDGRRNESQVRSLARQAGAADSCFAELVDLGMIAMAPSDNDAPSTQTQPTIPMPVRPSQDEPLHVDIPLDDAPLPPSAARKGNAVAARWMSRPEAEDSWLPAARTLQPESVLNDSALGELGSPDSPQRAFDAEEAACATEDVSLEEARAILLQAVRQGAPVTGSLTMMRLRRARSRGELAELVDEVESRIVKPYRSLAAQQVLRRARHLLTAAVQELAQA